jgi:DNA-directed RNA polymerase subunit M/transcription elongation factor TFIIS
MMKNPITLKTTRTRRKEEVILMGRPYKCPNCGSKRTHWKGYRKTEKGRKRLRKCTACKRRFATKIIVAG